MPRPPRREGIPSTCRALRAGGAKRRRRAIVAHGEGRTEGEPTSETVPAGTEAHCQAWRSPGALMGFPRPGEDPHTGRARRAPAGTRPPASEASIGRREPEGLQPQEPGAASWTEVQPHTTALRRPKPSASEGRRARLISVSISEGEPPRYHLEQLRDRPALAVDRSSAPDGRGIIARSNRVPRAATHCEPGA